MALTDENGGMNTTMLVSPANGYSNNSGFGSFGGDGWWIILLFILLGGGGMWGMNGGFGGMYEFPWLLNGQNMINANTNAGFDHAATQSALGNLSTAVTSGFGNVQNSLCSGFAGVNASISGAQNALAQQMYTNQISDLERSFAAQTATTNGLSNISSQLAQCCCDNRLATCQTQNIIQNEGNQTRFADANNTRDIIQSQSNGTQAILDKLCQLELDGVKAQVEAKNDRIAELQTQLNMANLAASKTAQNAFIQQGFANEVDQLYNRLYNCPVPTTPVYGRTPIFTCPQNVNSGCGCGCGGFAN